MHEQETLTRRALAAALPIVALAGATPVALAAARDPTFALITRHQTLRAAVTESSGADDDPAYLTACDNEEAALQALGNVVPASVAGAAALLNYMAEVEGGFSDPGSPLLRTVMTVAQGLRELSARTA